MSQLQDRIASMVHAFGDAERKDSVRALAQDVGALEARLAELERELEQAREDRARAAMDARNPLLARLAALEAEAKQAREDEAWALEAAVTINPAGSSESFAPTSWLVRYWDGVRTLEESPPTIHDALRALREKVEGGTR